MIVDVVGDMKAPIYAGMRFWLRYRNEDYFLDGVTCQDGVELVDQVQFPIRLSQTDFFLQFRITADLDEGQEVVILSAVRAWDGSSILMASKVGPPAAPAIPVRPNWSARVTKTLTFKTGIIVSDTGTEQRYSLTESPRCSVSYQALSLPDLMPEWESYIREDAHGEYLSPDMNWSRTAPGVDGVVSSIPVDLSDSGAYIGQRVIVFTPSGATVGRVASGLASVTLDEEQQVSASKGLHVMSAALSIREEDIVEDVLTRGVSTTSVTSRILPGRGGDTAPLQADDMPVFRFRHNAGKGQSREIKDSKEVIDFGHGAIRHRNPRAEADEFYSFTFHGQGQKGQELIDFFVAQKGMLRPFWMYIGRHYTPPVGLKVVPGLNGLLLVTCDIPLKNHPFKIGDRVDIPLNPYGGVSGVVAEIGVSHLGLNDNSVYGDLPLGELEELRGGAGIKLLSQVRFAQDEMILDYLNGNTFTTVLNVKPVIP